MKNYFIIFVFIFIVNCSSNEKGLNADSNNITHNKINSSKEYSFEEYVNLLLNNNRSKSYPDINNIPE